MGDQPAMTFQQYQRHFLTVDSCYAYLYRMKWPTGYRCSKCHGSGSYLITTRSHPLYECIQCGDQTTLTAGTIMEKTRTDITVWFAAIYLAVQDRHVSTATVANRLEIDYQKAWSMMKKIRAALASPACIANAPDLDEY